MDRIREKIISLSQAAGKAARLYEQGLFEDGSDAYIECLEQIDSLVDDIEEAMNTYELRGVN